MTGGGPKTRADEIDRQDYLTRRNNELREGEDAYDEAANLPTKRGAKKRRGRRKEAVTNTAKCSRKPAEMLVFSVVMKEAK